MKRILLIAILVIASITTYAQVEYTITKYRHAKLTKGVSKWTSPVKAVSKTTTSRLYNNALVISGEQDLYFKFAREIKVTDNDGGFTMWKATDKYDNECEVAIKDFGTFSKISVTWIKTGEQIVYQTL
jgi:hypothetical protein